MTETEARHEPANDRVRRWVKLDRPAGAVWGEIGGFLTIADWHPLVESCQPDEIGGTPHRYLRLTDGESMLEELLETGPHDYVTRIGEHQFPAGEIRATFACVAEPEGGCHVFWAATFEAADPMADEMVEAFFESGLAAIADRFG